MAATFSSLILDSLRGEVEALAARLRRSVVVVRSGAGVTRSGLRLAPTGAGSGVVWRAEGLIVTNHHVVARGDAAEIELSDGQIVPGRVVARDPVLDLAAIQVPVPRQTPDPGPGRAAGDWAPAPGAVPAPIGDSRTLRVGQLVLAMGHPWGMRNAVTAGIVSGWSSDNARRALIAAHLELQPGNSGGPLADVEGCVIGVNSMLAGPRFALAVPSHVVERFLGGAARGDYV